MVKIEINLLLLAVLTDQPHLIYHCSKFDMSNCSLSHKGKQVCLFVYIRYLATTPMCPPG